MSLIAFYGKIIIMHWFARSVKANILLLMSQALFELRPEL